jgi:hypothetical protein
MTSRLHWLPFLLLLLNAATPGSAAPSIPANGPHLTNPPSEYKVSDVTMALHRTSCYGECPAYSVTIRGNGECTYSGIRSVGVRGERKFRIELARVLDLLNSFYAVEFPFLKDGYLERTYVRMSPEGKADLSVGMVTDDPHIILSLSIGEYAKTVEKNSEFGPVELERLADMIDRITNSGQWTRMPVRK